MIVFFLKVIDDSRLAVFFCFGEGLPAENGEAADFISLREKDF